MPELLLDMMLGALLLSLAWGALHAQDLRASLGMFVVFGIVVALSWARLGSADLAFAEAAIGAGLMGTLLLQAFQSSASAVGGTRLDELPASRKRAVGAWLFTAIAVALLLTGALRQQEGGQEAAFNLTPLLPEQVQANLPASGVEHPVTAVLLNFRAWDTFLELLVLVVALFGVRQLYPRGIASLKADAGRRSAPAWPVLQLWSRFLAPLLVLVGGYVLWRGSSSPGGAFQAGALLAAAAVVLRLSGHLPPLRWSWWPVRLLICLGAALFLVVAVATLLLGPGWLSFPSTYALPLILLIEGAATLSIAATLALLVAGDSEDFGQ